jgi:hypothetical protein
MQQCPPQLGAQFGQFFCQIAAKVGGMNIEVGICKLDLGALLDAST